MPAATGAPIRVLVVEDSPTTRKLLLRLFESDPRFLVVGTAADGEEAVAQTARLRPDVLTMDLHLPRLDGVSATRRIMAETPTPIVVVSAHAQQRWLGPAFEALRAGAVSVLDTPPAPGHSGHEAAVHELLQTVRLMAEVKVVRRTVPATSAPTPRLRPAPAAPASPRPQVVGIAASTGGPQAIQTILQALGDDLPVPILVVQHIGHGFVAGMAAWLDATCAARVKLGEQGESGESGVIYLAPDDRHLLVTRRGSLALSTAPPVRGFRPSATLLFESLAESYGPRAIGAILTGMGDDGAAGLARLRAAGAPTIAQDEATAVVNGMPGAAVACGAAERVLPLPEIGPTIRDLLGLDGPGQR